MVRVDAAQGIYMSESRSKQEGTAHRIPRAVDWRHRAASAIVRGDKPRLMAAGVVRAAYVQLPCNVASVEQRRRSSVSSTGPATAGEVAGGGALGRHRERSEFVGLASLNRDAGASKAEQAGEVSGKLERRKAGLLGASSRASRDTRKNPRSSHRVQGGLLQSCGMTVTGCMLHRNHPYRHSGRVSCEGMQTFNRVRRVFGPYRNAPHQNLLFPSP